MPEPKTTSEWIKIVGLAVGVGASITGAVFVSVDLIAEGGHAIGLAAAWEGIAGIGFAIAGILGLKS